MSKVNSFILKIMIGILILFSLCVYGCDTSNQQEVSLEILYNHLTLTEGETLNLSSLYNCSDISTLKINSTDSTTIYIKDGRAYARAMGVASIIFSCNNNESEITKRISVSVVSNVKFASAIIAEDEIELKQGDSVTFDSIFSIMPKDCINNVKVTTDSSIVKISNGVVRANTCGTAKILVTAISGTDETIEKEITINIVPRVSNINLAVTLKDINLSDIDYIVDGESYIVAVNTFEGFNAKNISFSNNITKLMSYFENDIEYFVVLLDKTGDYEITYRDKDYFGTAKIINDYEHYNKNDFVIKLFNNNNEIDKNNDVYNFYIGYNTSSPYYTWAYINSYLVDFKLNDCDISIISNDNNAITLANNKITIKNVGFATLQVKNTYFEQEIDIVVEKAYVKTCELSYPTSVNLINTKTVSFEIIKDYSYNYLPDNIALFCETDGVEINDLKLNIINTNISKITGYVMVGDIRKDYEIDCYLYKIDRTYIRYRGNEINNEVIINDTTATLDYKFYNNDSNWPLSINSNYPLIVTIEHNGTSKTINLVRYLYLEDLTEGEYVITVYSSNQKINELTIIVQNSI